MTLLLLAIGAVALWAVIRLGRQTERAGRREWRIAATLLAAVAIGGGVLLLARGGWIVGGALVGAGIWLATASRLPALRSAPSEPLSETEARAILGVEASADAAAIQSAWRRQMARAHPDQGGTEGLAARVNAARDRLLPRG